MEKDFNVKLPLPVLSFVTRFKYNEVKPASGVAYIILILLNETFDKNELFTNKLESFGVPTHLHHIFANQLDDMVALKIISLSRKCVDDIYYTNHFKKYRIDDFELTEKGKSLLADGVMPTGQEKDKEVKLLYMFNNQTVSFVKENFIQAISKYTGNKEVLEFLDFLRENESEDYDIQNVTNLAQDFCIQRATSKEIGLVKKEVTSEYCIANDKQEFLAIDAKLALDIANLKYSLNTVNENIQSYAFRYLGKNNIAKALTILNDLGKHFTTPNKALNTIGSSTFISSTSISNSSNISNNFSTSTATSNINFSYGDIRSIPRDKINGVKLHLKDFDRQYICSITVDDNYQALNSGIITHKTINLKSSQGILAEIMPNLMAIKVESKDTIYGYIMTKNTFSQSEYVNSINGVNLDLELAVELKFTYADIKDALFSTMNLSYVDFSPEVLELVIRVFSIFDDYESILSFMRRWITFSTIAIEDLETMCKVIQPFSKNLKLNLYNGIVERIWPNIYNNGLDLIKNDDEIKDNIEYFSPKFISIGNSLGLSIENILKDVIDVSDRKDDTLLNQYYYFRGLGFNDKTVFKLINPIGTDFEFNPITNNKISPLDSFAIVINKIKELKDTLHINTPGVDLLEKDINSLNWSNLNPNALNVCNSVLSYIQGVIKDTECIAIAAPSLLNKVKNAYALIDRSYKSFINKKISQNNRQSNNRNNWQNNNSYNKNNGNNNYKNYPKNKK